MQMNPYLSFNGQCEAAFKFYEQCLGGQPPVVEIDEKGERRVTVWLPAAAISAAETSLELLIVASSDEPTQTSSNSAFQRLSIVKD